MKNMKKTLTMVVSLVLIAAIAIGGTVAYLTVDPVKKGNVFSVGDVDIKLDEIVDVEGQGGTVVEGENGATYTGVMPGDYLKKEVSVENVGKSPAYVAVTVTMNNALKINKAIDEFYEGKGYTAAEIQAIYDYIFDGFGFNYTKTDANGNATGMRLTITGNDMPDYALQVDTVKTISEYWQQYSGNWFKDEVTKIPAAGQPYNGYYTLGMEDYELKYTYYLLLEAGQKSTLFNGLNVPIEFNKDQLAMFDGLSIDVVASAIQADNIEGADETEKAKNAFTILKKEIIWEVSTADELAEQLKVGGNIKLADDIAIDEALVVPAGVTANLDLNGKAVSTSTAAVFSVAETAAYTGVAIVNNGTLNVFNEGEVVSAGSYVIQNTGDLTIENGTFSGMGGINSKAGKVTINGGNFYAASRWQDGTYQHTLKAENTEVVINGGNFDATVNGQTNAVIGIAGGAVMTINGGNFKNVEGALGNFDPYLFNYEKDGKLVINDGTFYGGWRFNGVTATTTINGGDFTVGFDGQSFNASSTHVVTVYGGTFAAGSKLAGKLTDIAAAGYEVTTNADGSVTVSAKKVASSSELSAAIAEGKAVELTSDVTFANDIRNDAVINLGENTMTMTSSDQVVSNDLTVSDGTVDVSKGYFDIRPTDESVVVFEDVDFVNNAKGPSYGPSTNRLESVVEFSAPTEGKKAEILFKNCTFKNAQVLLEGMSGNTGIVEVTFENCTFDALTSDSPIKVQNYVTATVNVKNCVFNLECTSSTASAISVSPSSSTSAVINADGNTINAVVATPVTSENPNEVVKVNGTPANIKFASYYANTTANITNTTATGVAAK